MRVLSRIPFPGPLYTALLLTTTLSGQVTISGRMMWTDHRGEPGTHSHPIRLAQVEIIDERESRMKPIRMCHTDEAGTYRIEVPTPPGTSRDIRVRVRTISDFAYVHPESTSRTYFLESAVHKGLTAGSARFVNLTAERSASDAVGANDAFSVHDAIVSASQYARRITGQSSRQLEVIYPFRDHSQFVHDTIHIHAGDRWDWDVIMHEFGHYVAVTHGIDEHPKKGNHYIWGNLAEIPGLEKAEGIRLAWAEAWPTFFSVVGQLRLNLQSKGLPNVGDTAYSDTGMETEWICADLEGDRPDGPCPSGRSTLASSRGEDCELAIMRVLWRLTQGSRGSLGGFRTDDVELFRLLKAEGATTMAAAWQALVRNRSNSDLDNLAAIAVDHGLAPSPDAPMDGALISDALPTFGWQAGGGGPQHENDSFEITFLDDKGEIILQRALSAMSYQPDIGEWTKIRAARGKTVRWQVSGRNTTSPATGPYTSVFRSLHKP